MTEPSASEIIAEIYRQAKQLREDGQKPREVILPIHFIRRLRVHKFLIGEMPEKEMDYLQNHSVFDLEFLVHDSDEIIVRS